ncbi:molybdopterin-binding protein [Kordiimonas sp. SCSIO 12610]|uniref:competence/damage-inducible protein A n=1 Tax=Kordiimonas sp. SCSIO 12610 TaxID=2829597 RepID=UPI00210CE48B|nr:molybdopterin-binding protein [Kordiimonas sp. SCSIO 12610]UTW56579.1 competence/damage-inducible protein A [Kordiimonas sp. SCSIO 12610]
MQTNNQHVKAALLIIGDEILSGRTQDKNTSYIATWLNEAGIQLSEVRIVPDIEDEIVHAVNRLRAKYDYLFTTGGIGPTHDDITAEAMGAAFELPVHNHPEAYARLLAYYGEENFTDARQRMTRVPEGGELIENPVSIAPGFKIENVFVMAGVPKVMQAMLEKLRHHLKGGRKVHSKTVTIHAPESVIADTLGNIEASVEGISIGSYPFYHEGKVGAQIVTRSVDQDALTQAQNLLVAACEASEWEYDTE